MGRCSNRATLARANECILKLPGTVPLWFYATNSLFRTIYLILLSIFRNSFLKFNLVLFIMQNAHTVKVKSIKQDMFEGIYHQLFLYPIPSFCSNHHWDFPENRNRTCLKEEMRVHSDPFNSNSDFQGFCVILQQKPFVSDSPFSHAPKRSSQACLRSYLVTFFLHGAHNSLRVTTQYYHQTTIIENSLKFCFCSFLLKVNLTRKIQSS